MQIEIPLEEVDINKAIADRIMTSALGEILREHIEKFITEEHAYGKYSLERSMSDAVDQVLTKIVIDLIRNEFADKIRTAVRDKLTDAVVNELVCKALDKFLLGD